MIKHLNEQMEAGHAKENMWELAAVANRAGEGQEGQDLGCTDSPTPTPFLPCPGENPKPSPRASVY